VPAPAEHPRAAADPGRALPAPSWRERPETPKPKPRTAGEIAFLDLGPGAHKWLVEAAAVGVQRIRSKMAAAVELAAMVGVEQVDAALMLAAIAGRFGDGALAPSPTTLQPVGRSSSSSALTSSTPRSPAPAPRMRSRPDDHHSVEHSLEQTTGRPRAP